MNVLVGNVALQWRHDGRDGVSNHQPHDCLLNRPFRRRSKKTSKLRVNDLCAGNSPVTGEFPAQRASNAENVSISWRHHVYWWLEVSLGMSFRCVRTAYTHLRTAVKSLRLRFKNHRNYVNSLMVTEFNKTLILSKWWILFHPDILQNKMACDTSCHKYNNCGTVDVTNQMTRK